MAVIIWGAEGRNWRTWFHCSADRGVAIASVAAKDRNLAATTEGWQRWALRLPSGMTEDRNKLTYRLIWLLDSDGRLLGRPRKQHRRVRLPTQHLRQQGGGRP